MAAQESGHRRSSFTVVRAKGLIALGTVLLRWPPLVFAAAPAALFRGAGWLGRVSPIGSAVVAIPRRCWSSPSASSGRGATGNRAALPETASREAGRLTSHSGDPSGPIFLVRGGGIGAGPDRGTSRVHAAEVSRRVRAVLRRPRGGRRRSPRPAGRGRRPACPQRAGGDSPVACRPLPSSPPEGGLARRSRARDDFGMLPIHWATDMVHRDDARCLSWLLGHGADPGRRSADRRTRGSRWVDSAPIASDRGSLAAAGLLIGHHADVKAPAGDGSTALHVAAGHAASTRG